MIGRAHKLSDQAERRNALRFCGVLTRRIAAGLFGHSATGWLSPVLGPYRHRLLLLLLLGLVAASIGLVPPYLSKLVIDEGLMAGDVNALFLWSGCLFVVGLGAVGLGALNNILHMRASVQMLADLRQKLLEALMAKPQSWLAGQRAGELLARVDGDAGEVQQFAFNAVLGGLSSIVRLLGGTVMLMVLNWKLGLLVAILAPIELLFLTWARPRTTALAGNTRSARGQLTAGLAETLHSLSGLQIARGTGWAKARSLGDQTTLNNKLITQQHWLEFTRAVPQVLSAIMRSVIFLIGGVMVIRGDWPLGSLIAFIAYTGFMIGPMQSLLGLWHAQARAKVALGRLDELFRTGDTTPSAIHTPPIADFTLVAKSLRYGRPEDPGFGPVSFILPQGTKTLLNGPSGVGKTSLLMVLSGHAAPLGGQLSLEGKTPPSGWQRHIAFATQRPIILRGSLRDNLFLAADNPVSDTRIWQVLSALGLDARFRAAQGLDTFLGENGLTLSGGERQRICLARALLSSFDLLILDEALSEVDARTIQQIIAFIDKEFGTRSRIITTHSDTEAYGHFDQVIRLPQGTT